MKIINRYIFNKWESNGPSSYEILIEVIELENGMLLEVVPRSSGISYKKFVTEDLEKRKGYTLECLNKLT